MLSLDQVCLARVVGVGQAVASKGITLITYLLIISFIATDGAKMKFALWRIAAITIEKGRSCCFSKHSYT